jgi:hypothetical protein
LAPGTTVQLPAAARQHVFLAVGSGRLHDQPVGAGDAVRLTEEPGVTFEATEETELLAWSFSR